MLNTLKLKTKRRNTNIAGVISPKNVFDVTLVFFFKETLVWNEQKLIL